MHKSLNKLATSMAIAVAAALCVPAAAAAGDQIWIMGNWCRLGTDKPTQNVVTAGGKAMTFVWRPTLLEADPVQNLVAMFLEETVVAAAGDGYQTLEVFDERIPRIETASPDLLGPTAEIVDGAWRLHAGVSTDRLDDDAEWPVSTIYKVKYDDMPWWAADGMNDDAAALVREAMGGITQVGRSLIDDLPEGDLNAIANNHWVDDGQPTTWAVEDVTAVLAEIKPNVGPLQMMITTYDSVWDGSGTVQYANIKPDMEPV